MVRSKTCNLLGNLCRHNSYFYAHLLRHSVLVDDLVELLTAGQEMHVRKWAAFAEVLSRGFSALPRGAVPALVLASLAGIVITVYEMRKVKWVPSPTAPSCSLSKHGCLQAGMRLA